MIESPHHQGSPVSTDLISALIALARISGAAPLGTVAAQLSGLVLNSIPAVAVCLAVVQDSRVVHLEISGGALGFVLDERQYPAGFGPCLDAARSERTVIIEDTNAGKYAPYRQLIHRHGVRQVVSVPLLPSTPGPGIGSLTVYGADVRRPQGAPSDELVNLFASLASVVLGDALRYGAAVVSARQSGQAFQSCVVIEQAKGMMMYGLRCSADDALERLNHLTSTSGLKLRDVATLIVHHAGMNWPSKSGPARG